MKTVGRVSGVLRLVSIFFILLLFVMVNDSVEISVKTIRNSLCGRKFQLLLIMKESVVSLNGRMLSILRCTSSSMNAD